MYLKPGRWLEYLFTEISPNSDKKCNNREENTIVRRNSFSAQYILAPMTTWLTRVTEGNLPLIRKLVETNSARLYCQEINLDHNYLCILRDTLKMNLHIQRFNSSSEDKRDRLEDEAATEYNLCSEW